MHLMHQWQSPTTERDDREAVHGLQAAANDACERRCDWLASTPPHCFWAFEGLNLLGRHGLCNSPAVQVGHYLSRIPISPLFLPCQCFNFAMFREFHRQISAVIFCPVPCHLPTLGYTNPSFPSCGRPLAVFPPLMFACSKSAFFVIRQTLQLFGFDCSIVQSWATK